MDLDKRPAPPAPERYEPGDGCLTTAIRIPVRIVVLVLVVPVRMVWDLLAAGARALHRSVFRPLGRGIGVLCSWVYETLLAPLGRALGVVLGWVFRALFVWPWVALWRYVLVPVVYYGLVVPVVWLYASVLTPIGHGVAHVCSWVYETLLTPTGHVLGVVLGWVFRALFVWPWVALWRYVLVPVVYYGLVVPVVWLYRYVLTPIGHGTLWSLTWLGRGIALTAVGIRTALVWLVVTLLITPLGWFFRAVLTPVGREIAAAFGVAWRIAGQISRAVGRALKWLARILIGQPVSWFYRSVCTPVGHILRDSVWAPARKAAAETGRAVRGALRSARETVRQARRDAWRALVGAPRPAEPVAAPVDGARTLGSTTTVPGAVPAPEISLRKQV
ncbi:hypothetical protein [Streptomyces sp. NP-1717]|uniref:hypothetical protein n=1 Tax=Streptomyces sp. NP-1717 TaxID=2704470 RepID=UPI001F5CC04A|nr:hypothetical protein [Streptomyces sp. NP-1717]MCI3221612.1 hypothetical protein [Streptomyces sp. NP-1717]